MSNRLILACKIVADLLSLALNLVVFRLLMMVAVFYIFNPYLLLIVVIALNVTNIWFAISSWSDKLYGWMRSEVLYWVATIKFRKTGKASMSMLII